MGRSCLIRVSDDLKKSIDDIKQEIESKTGNRISRVEAGRILTKMQKYKKFKVQIKKKGLMEIQSE